MLSKKFPGTGEHVGIIFVAQKVTMATLWPAKTPLISSLSAYISKTARWNKQDKIQLLA